MANNKICCETKKVEKTYLMNDRDYLSDLLASEKAITVNTTTALIEASNRKLHAEIKEFFNIVEDIQIDTYEMAWNYGWYSLEEADENKVSKKVDELEKKLEEFNC